MKCGRQIAAGTIVTHVTLNSVCPAVSSLCIHIRVWLHCGGFVTEYKIAPYSKRKYWISILSNTAELPLFVGDPPIVYKISSYSQLGR